MACSEYDAATSLLLYHSDLSGWGGCRTYVDHIHSHGSERAYYYIAHHRTAQASVTPYYYGAGIAAAVAIHECCVGSCELYDIKRGEAFAGYASNGAAYAGYGLYERHIS